MTERQFIRLVKQMRTVQAEYKASSNMRLHNTITRLELQVDNAIRSYETRWQYDEPEQTKLRLFNDAMPPDK